MANYGTYASLGQLRARLGYAAADTADDTTLLEKLDEASRFIDEECHRWFSVRTETRYYSALCSSHLLLDADLLSINSLKTDDDGDRTYETTWQATDYDLEPYNEYPKWRLSSTPNGSHWLPVGIPRGIEIAGTWGYGDGESASPWTPSGATVTVGTTTGTSITASSGTPFSAGQTILAGSEQMYVSAVATNTLTVVRGVNGTTAAIQAAATASIARYPKGIVEACLTLASESFTMQGAPLGVAGSSEMAEIRMRPSVWGRVQGRLAPFKRVVVG